LTTKFAAIPCSRDFFPSVDPPPGIFLPSFILNCYAPLELTRTADLSLALLSEAKNAGLNLVSVLFSYSFPPEGPTSKADSLSPFKTVLEACRWPRVRAPFFFVPRDPSVLLETVLWFSRTPPLILEVLKRGPVHFY